MVESGVFWYFVTLIFAPTMDCRLFWGFHSVLSKCASFVTIVATYSVKNTDLSNCSGKTPRWRAGCFGVFMILIVAPTNYRRPFFWCFQSVLSKYASFNTIVATYSVKNTDLSNCLGKAPRWRAVCFYILWSLLSPQQWIVALFWGAHFFTYTIYKISSNSHLFSPIHNGRPLLRIPPRNSDPSDSNE